MLHQKHLRKKHQEKFYVTTKNMLHKDVVCYGKNKDRYGRLIAVCFTENLNLNSTMVKEGWAIAYRYYSKDYVKDEETARKLKKGIWQGTFIEPYSWRKNKN